MHRCYSGWGLLSLLRTGMSVSISEGPLFCIQPRLFSAESGTVPPARLCMRLQSSFSRIIVKLHLLSHVDTVVPVASPRWTVSFSTLWNGSSYANLKPGLHPSPCLRIRGNETSMHKQAIQIQNSTCTLHQRKHPRRTPVHGVSPALKLGKQKEKNTKKQPLKGNVSHCHQMAMALHLFVADPAPGKGHRCHLQSTPEKQSL